MATVTVIEIDVKVNHFILFFVLYLQPGCAPASSPMRTAGSNYMSILEYIQLQRMFPQVPKRRCANFEAASPFPPSLVKKLIQNNALLISVILFCCKKETLPLRLVA